MPLTKQPKIKKKWARMIAPVSIIVTNQNKIMGSSLRLQDISGIIAEQDIFLDQHSAVRHQERHEKADRDHNSSEQCARTRIGSPVSPD